MTKPAQFLGVDTTNEDGTAACWHCGLPTRGGDFLPGHDAKLVAVLVSEVKYGNLTAEAVLAAFPAYRTGLRNKVARALVKAGLLKVGYADSAEGQQSEWVVPVSLKHRKPVREPSGAFRFLLRSQAVELPAVVDGRFVLVDERLALTVWPAWVEFR